MLTLKQFRLKYKFSQNALAKRLGTTPRTLNMYETGQWTINQVIIDKIKEEFGEDIRPLVGKQWISVPRKKLNQK